MTRRRPRLFDEQRGHVPRCVTAAEVAWELGLSENKFAELLPRYQSEGLPRPDALSNRYDLKAVHHWLDERAGLSNASSPDQLERELEALVHGENPRAASG